MVQFNNKYQVKPENFSISYPESWTKALCFIAEQSSFHYDYYSTSMRIIINKNNRLLKILL